MDPTLDDPDLAAFELAAVALFGEEWRTEEMARALGVGKRRVRAWRAGESVIPPGVWHDLAALLRDRQNAMLPALILCRERATAAAAAADPPDAPPRPARPPGG